jgi:hypothetical protein
MKENVFYGFGVILTATFTEWLLQFVVINAGNIAETIVRIAVAGLIQYYLSTHYIKAELRKAHEVIFTRQNVNEEQIKDNKDRLTQVEHKIDEMLLKPKKWFWQR